jgi:hypothetical protein
LLIKSVQSFRGKHLPRLGHVQQDGTAFVVLDSFSQPPAVSRMTTISLNAINRRLPSLRPVHPGS